ncbi:MAG: hypothetical protein KAI47_16905, partial [Deltaproteobacteria bacterium]|nr:hypothetical protein [Deltaproteobacteria bacterium]
MARRGVLGIVLALVALTLVYSAFRRWTLHTLPIDDGPPLPRNIQIHVGETATKISLAESWMVRRDGLWRIHISGAPRLLGHSHGMLVNRIFAPVERRLDQRFRTAIPPGVARWIFENRLRWTLRGLMPSIHPHRLAEVAAFARTIIDTQHFAEEPFQRILTYHAIPDVLQARRRDALFPSVAFAVWGKQAAGGHMLVARSMELGLGEAFDRERAIVFVRGRGRIPFVSLAWPGALGVISGVNARRIFVGVIWAKTETKLRPKTPAVFIARDILERAAT